MTLLADLIGVNIFYSLEEMNFFMKYYLFPMGISITLVHKKEFTLIFKFMVCSNPFIVDTMSVCTIPTPHVIS